MSPPPPRGSGGPHSQGKVLQTWGLPRDGGWIRAFVAADMKIPHIPTDPLPTPCQVRIPSTKLTLPEGLSQGSCVQSAGYLRGGEPNDPGGTTCSVLALGLFQERLAEAHGTMGSQAFLLHSPPAPGPSLSTSASIKEALAMGSPASHVHPWLPTPAAS